MNDDFSDWGDNSVAAAAPVDTRRGNEDPFADWGSPGEAPSADTGPSYLTDIPASVAADAAGFVGANLTAGEVAAERSGYPNVASAAQAGSTMFHEAEDWLRSKETDAFKKSQEAAAFADKGQEQLGANPLRQFVAKMSGVAVPGVIAGVGALAAGPVGSAGALGYYQLVQDLDRAVAWTNRVNDEDLTKSAPVFGDLLKMHVEDNLAAGMTQAEAEKQASRDARTDLHSALYTGGQALFSAGSGALMGVGASKLLKGGVNTKGLVDLALGAAETGTGMGAAGAASEYSRQSADIAAKGDGQLDPKKMLTAFLNGEVEGILFHAGHAGASAGLRRFADRASAAAQSPQAATTQQPAAPTTMSPGLFAEKQATNVPSEGAAASTGVAPKTTRADTQPPPNEAAQEGEIGNTVNPPTRDQGVGPAGQKIKAKKRNAQEPEIYASVEALSEKAPASDEAAALAASLPDATADLSSIQVPPRREPGPEPLQRLEVPDAPVTPEVNRAAEVPEAPPTIDAQLDDFNNKRRDVIRFENADQVPDDLPAGVKEHEASDGSVWWYQGKTNLRQIRKSIKDGTENELLGLGPKNKQEVLTDVAQGETPAAGVLRTEDGVEKGAAATTVESAAPTLDALAENAGPGDTIGLEPLEAVIAGRENGTGQPRILRATTEEAVARDQAAQAALNASLDKNMASVMSADKEQAGPEGRKRGKAEVAAREHGNKVANEVVAKYVPDEVAEKDYYDGRKPGAKVSRDAILARAKSMVDAYEAGVKEFNDTVRTTNPEAKKEHFAKIPERVADNAVESTNHNANATLLAEARRLTKIKAPKSADFQRFLSREKAARGGDREGVVADRRAEGDAALRRNQGDVEAPVGDVSDALSTGTKAEIEDRLVDELDEDTSTRIDPDFEKRLQNARQRTASLPIPEKVKEKLAKVQALAERGATEGERAAAKEAANRVQENVVGQFVTKGTDKAGTFERVEPKRRTINKPQSRSFEETDFTRAFEAKEKSERDTGEREGHVSYDYGSAVASAKISRTAKVRDVFEQDTHKHSRTEGLFGTLFRHIRGKLIDVAGDVDVHFISADEMNAIHPGGEKAKGFYKEKARGEGGYIVMREGLSRDEMAHVFTHEALHAATSDALSTHERLADQVRSIMGEVSATLERAPELQDLFKRSFIDEHEFIAEAFSNREFQEYLTTVKVSPKLARELGLPETRAQSVWRAMTRAIQKALGFEPGTVTALEALMKPTAEAMDLFGGEGRGGQRSLTADDVTRGVRRGAINLGERTRAAKRALQTDTMIAMSARRMGDYFYKLTRQVDDLSKRMEVERNQILEQEGGKDLAVEARELARKDPVGMERGSDLANYAAELQVDPTDLAKNDHVFKVKDPSRGGQWWQAKKALDKANPDNILDQWSAFSKAHPDAAAYFEKASNWGRDANNKAVREVLTSVLDRAKLYSPNLVSRILKEGKVPDADKALFKSEALIDHIDRFVGEEGRQGWYFPAMREGNFVVTAKRDFDVQESAVVQRIKDNGQTNVVQFLDPSGGNSELKARRAAKGWVESHTAKVIAGERGQLHMVGRPEKVWVDKRDPTKLLDASDVNATPAYRVRMQDEYMSKHMTEAEARETKEAMDAAGWTGAKFDKQRLNPNAKWSGFMPSQYEALLNSLRDREKFKGMDPQQQAEMILAMHHANVKLLPGSRMQHHRLPRKNVAGFDKDFPNVVSRWVQMNAGFRARVRNIGAIDETLKEMRTEADRMDDKKNVQRTEIIQALEDRIYSGREFQPTGRMTALLGKASMVGKLVGPSQPIINATEVGMVTAPVLAGYHGVGRTTAALAQAYKAIGAVGIGLAGLKDVARAYRTDHGFTSYRDFIKDNIDRAGLVSDRATRLKQLIDHLHDMNLFGHEAGMEVQRLARTGDTGVERFLDRTDLMFRQVNQAIEAINRSVTGIAAYELQYRKNGGNHIAAMEYARDIVHDTMGDYSAGNAAPIFNTGFGKLALQFKKYAQKSYGLLGKMAADAYQGDPGAQRAFIGVMLTHGVAAGALGLPGMELIKAALLVPGLLGGYSYDDFQDTIRSVANDLFGQKLGEAVTRGFPRMAGVDVSGRLGWDSLALPQRNPASYKDIKEWGYDMFAGAPGSLPVEMLRSVSAAAQGEFGKAVEAGPSKFGRDIYRAVHGYTSGFQNETGREKIPPLSIGQAATYAAGFRPAGVAALQEKQEFMRRRTAERTGDRQKLINAWVNATPESKAAAREAVAQYNATAPGNARILPKDLIGAQKRRNTEKRTGSFKDGIRVNKRNRDLFEEATDIYGGQ